MSMLDRDTDLKQHFVKTTQLRAPSESRSGSLCDNALPSPTPFEEGAQQKGLTIITHQLLVHPVLCAGIIKMFCSVGKSLSC